MKGKLVEVEDTLTRAARALRIQQKASTELAQLGISSIDELSRTFGAIRKSLAALDAAELEGMRREMSRVTELLRDQAGHLEHLRGLKDAFARPN